MLEVHHELQPKLKTTDESKAALQTIGEKLPQEHINKAVANFDNRLTILTWRWLPIMVTLSICSDSVHLLSPHPSLATNKLALFRATNRLPAKNPLGTLRNGELSWLKQHNFVIFRYNLTKLGGKILLLNSCVKFHAKIRMHCWNIKNSHRDGGLLLRVHPVCNMHVYFKVDWFKFSNLNAHLLFSIYVRYLGIQWKTGKGKLTAVLFSSAI